LYGKFNGMFMDAYGRVGVAIYDDRIGLAKSSDVAAVRDRLPSSLTTAGNFRVAVAEDAVGLARDSTLAAVRDRLPSSLTSAGNLRIAVVEDAVGLAKSTDVSAIQPRNIARWGDTTLTGRDITQDIARLQNLDVALSTRASESTLGGIKSQTDKLTFDASNRLFVNAAVVANPPNLDVALSTRASESTLAAVRDRLPSSLTSAGNFKAAVVEDGVGLAKESTLSSILGRLDVALSTRASESTLSSIKAQTDKLTFDTSNRLYVVDDQLLAMLTNLITAAGNLRVSLQETTIKQPVDVQDHWTESVVLLPSAARTASGAGSDVDVGRFLYAEVCVDVTAVSGTDPVLNVYVEGKDRYTGKYKTLLSFENISSVQTLWGTITMLAFTLVRVRWTISGTSPSFTFSVSGEFKS
ncbi:MAG: hypothetical protein QXU69_08850, partial [Thermofilaceae archaeon]